MQTAVTSNKTECCLSNFALMKMCFTVLNLLKLYQYLEVRLT